MTGFKGIEFVCLMWILIGLLNFCHVHSSDSDSISADVDFDVNFDENPNSDNSSFFNEIDPVPVVLNKCDPNSFNFPFDVERFTSVFGYFNGSLIYDFKFDSGFNRSKHRCKTIETVKIPFSFTSTSTSTSENETAAIHAQPKFWRYGFFNHTHNFFINPENYCVKKLENPESKNTSEWILNMEICSSSNTRLHFVPALQKCCGIQEILSIDEAQNVTCEYSQHPLWKPETMDNKDIHPNYNFSLPCPLSSHFILPYQFEAKIKKEKHSPIIFKEVRMLQNGQVETRDTGNHMWKKLKPSEYCIDGFYHQRKSNEIEPFAKIPADSFMVIQCTRVQVFKKAVHKVHEINLRQPSAKRQ